MKNVLLLAGLLFIGGLAATAQAGIKASEREKIQQLFQKDTSYGRFRTQLKQVMKTAKGPNSNAVAVKNLFAKNKGMLARMVNTNKIIPSAAPSWGTVTSTVPIVFGELPQNKGIYAKRQIYTAPYADQFTGHFLYPSVLDELNSDPSVGRIGYKYDNDGVSDVNVGGKTITFTQPIPAVNDPTYLTARIEFQYSFMITGWDSKFADFEIGLYLNCRNFRNDDFFALPLIYESETHRERLKNWRRVKSIVPRVYVEDDIETVNKTVEGSFIIDGYIDPTLDISIRFDAAYAMGDKGGIFWSYHYGEFKLKRIIVSYFKAGN